MTYGVVRAFQVIVNTLESLKRLASAVQLRPWPGRSQHQALDALYTGLLTRKVNWVLDLDIGNFLDPSTQCPLIHEISPVDRPLP